MSNPFALPQLIRCGVCSEDMPISGGVLEAWAIDIGYLPLGEDSE